jgi:hypothetical protein
MGFIYKIEVDNELYIGSTKQKLYQRQQLHNKSLNNPNDSHYNIPLYRFCREKKVKKIICELIETVDDSELKIFEQGFINLLEPSLNTRRAYQTIEEHKEQIRLNNKINNNKKSNCPICDKLMLQNNIKRHIRNNH